MRKVKIIAIGGGKGGVGKSFIASSLACGLALNGNKVILIDADLGGANMHTLFGINYPEKTLSDYLQKKVEKLDDIFIQTQLDNLKLICGATDILELANPKSTQKDKIISAISRLVADYVIIDIGAGSSFANLDFFNMADLGIIVASLTPTSIQNAYGFIKLGVIRKLSKMFSDNPLIKWEISNILESKDKKKNMDELIKSVKEIDDNASQEIVNMLSNNKYSILINMATEMEGEKASQAMAGVVYHFLKIRLPFLGNIGFEKEVEKSIRRMKPLMLSDNNTILEPIMRVINKSISEIKQKESDLNQPIKKDKNDSNDRSANTHICLNEEIFYGKKSLHLHTEDLGIEKKQILTIVFSGGKILFSKTINYDEFLSNGENIQKKVNDKVKSVHKETISDVYEGKVLNIERL